MKDVIIGNRNRMSDPAAFVVVVMFGKAKVPMAGIQYVIDAEGRKVAVQIDLRKHRALREDIQDVLVSRPRRHEKVISLEKAKESGPHCPDQFLPRIS
jgi:hypothetical protein